MAENMVGLGLASDHRSGARADLLRRS